MLYNRIETESQFFHNREDKAGKIACGTRKKRTTTRPVSCLYVPQGCLIVLYANC